MKNQQLIERLVELTDEHILGLSDVLADCVEGGASVGFMSPFTRDRAVEFWSRVAQAVAAEERALLIAWDEAGICGTVQLILDLQDATVELNAGELFVVPRGVVNTGDAGGNLTAPNDVWL